MFSDSEQSAIKKWWSCVTPDIQNWRSHFKWPAGKTLEDSIKARNELERLIQLDLARYQYLSKKTFDAVMIWGFGYDSSLTESQIAEATKDAFDFMRQNELTNAALTLVKLPGIGISRASKILALSNQADLAIYDSRVAHGLSDLKVGNKCLIRIPAGRSIHGHPGSSDVFCNEFNKFQNLMSQLRDFAIESNLFTGMSPRVADVEIAFFTRSRLGLLQVPADAPTVYSQHEQQRLDGNQYLTLGKGHPFYADISESGISFQIGREFLTSFSLSTDFIENCIRHFEGDQPFPLGNAVDNVLPNGLGEFFQNQGKSSKYASHFAAVMVANKTFRRTPHVQGQRGVWLAVAARTIWNRVD